MKKSTFRGGIHINEHKNTAACPVTPLPAPKTVTVPLTQHIGVPCTPLVAVGDKVTMGQLIGAIPSGLGCAVHSSVSGEVKEIRVRHSASGAPITDIVIDNDGQNTLAPLPTPLPPDATPADVLQTVRDAGICGLGGATFPTHEKIRSAVGRVDTLLINCAECEPYITANHRLLLEDPRAVLDGTLLLCRACGTAGGILAVEDNKADAIALLASHIDADYPTLTLRVVKTKYPQGDERQLIFAVTGKELPMGALPADAGCVVFNAETAASVARAAKDGMPLIRRIVTVDGDCIKTPGNFLVPIGTPIRDVIAAAGGYTQTPARLLSGGPMMGVALWSEDEPVTKGTSCILALSKADTASYAGEAECIRCGRCVGVCPMHLPPVYLSSYSRIGDYAAAEEYGVMRCMECGSCSYICPAGIPLVQYIRQAKTAIRNQKKGGAKK